MKVLLISPVPPPMGGIAVWSQKFMTGIRRLGVDIDVVNTSTKSDHIVRLNENRGLRGEISRLKEILRDFREKLIHNHYDIVHISTSCSVYGMIRDIFCALCARRHGSKVITHFHCDVGFQITKTIQKWQLKLLLKLSNYAITLNSDSLQYIENLKKCSATIVPNFIEDSYIKSNFEVRNEIRKAVCVGRVEEEKGVYEIIEVAKMQPSIEFELVGFIDDYVYDLEIPDNIKLHGEQPQELIKKFIYASDIFLFPSHTEGFSMALLEAMACGIPVIATDVGANRDMIEGKGGTIVRVCDVNAMSAALDNMRSSDIRTDMSRWNIEKVKTKYCESVVMDYIQSIYQCVQNISER